MLFKFCFLIAILCRSWLLSLLKIICIGFLQNQQEQVTLWWEERLSWLTRFLSSRAPSSVATVNCRFFKKWYFLWWWWWWWCLFKKIILFPLDPYLQLLLSFLLPPSLQWNPSLIPCKVSPILSEWAISPNCHLRSATLSKPHLPNPEARPLIK